MQIYAYIGVFCLVFSLILPQVWIQQTHMEDVVYTPTYPYQLQLIYNISNPN